METIHTPDHVPDEPGVYRLLDGDEVAAIVTIPELDLEEVGDVSVELSGHAPRPAGRAFADTLGVPVVKRWRTNSARTNRRLARMADKGYSISRIVHIPGQRRATWSFVKVTR